MISSSTASDAILEKNHLIPDHKTGCKYYINIYTQPALASYTSHRQLLPT